MAFPLQTSSVHIDVPLTNITVAFVQEASNFVAGRVFPVVSVDKQSNKYYTYRRGDFNRAGQVKKRSAGTEANTIGMSVSNDSYFANVYSIGMDFDFETLANEDAALEIRSAGATLLTTQMLIHRELTWVDSFFKASVWGTDYTGVSGSPSGSQVRQWSDYTNSTPIRDVLLLKRLVQLKSGGYRPNVMVMGKEVRDTLINHPDILARINGGATSDNPAYITDKQIAAAFDMEEILVMEAIQNTAAEGLAESNAFIGGKEVLLAYRPATPGKMIPSAGYTFAWDGPEYTNGYGINVQSYSGDFLKIKGIAERIEANMAYDHKVVSSDLGAFIASVVA